MKFIKATTVISILVSLLLTICLVGCSGKLKDSTDSVLPAVDSMSGNSENLPKTHVDNNSRTPIAFYEAMIDPVSQSFTVVPNKRYAQYHYPLTELFPNSLQVVDYGYEPYFWAEIKLRHPIQGSGIDFFDPRVIAIVPVHSGAYFHYPNLGVYANNGIILEPDGYTQLFNDLAPGIFGNTNPFIAYFKDQPYRRWSSTDVTEETIRWEMDYNGFGGDFRFILVVDVSSNYPNPPTPRIDNAREPVFINAAVRSGLNPNGGNALIEATLLDWQGYHTIGGVEVEAPDFFDGTINLTYSGTGLHSNEYVYRGSIANEKLAPEGDYRCLVASWSQGSNIFIYNEFTVEVRFPSNMIYIPEGLFIMGGDDENEGEIGQFMVDLPAFYISSTAVTNAEYKEFVDATGYPPPTSSYDPSKNVWTGNTFPSELADHPVVNVSWDDSKAYCDWAGYYLPSEIEWEKAARGTDGRLYPWGDEWDVNKCRNAYNRGNDKTCSVWDYSEGMSPYGLHNAAGNVWERTADWYCEDAYIRYKDGDLTPPSSGTFSVIRGGSWWNGYPNDFRCTLRIGQYPEARYDYIGFRCAMTP